MMRYRIATTFCKKRDRFQEGPVQRANADHSEIALFWLKQKLLVLFFNGLLTLRFVKDSNVYKSLFSDAGLPH